MHVDAFAAIGSRASAVCKPQGNQQLKILKINWKYNSDPIIPFHLINNKKFKATELVLGV